MKKTLLSLTIFSALSLLTFNSQASFCGMFKSAYKTVAGLVVGSIDVGVEAVGIVIPGIDRESRERASQDCCYQHNTCEICNS